MADPATALEAALAYADRGWFVFPVQVAPNKRPLCEHGYKDATTDHAQIVAWWQQWPAAQVGVDCGRSGIVTVDLDEKPDADGFMSWGILELEHGCAGCGLEMKTPRGRGRQLFFSDPEKACRRRLGVRPGIDLLGEGGYTIVPSPASPGRSWTYGDPFEVDDLVPAPAWIVELGGERRANSDRSSPLAPVAPARLTPLLPEQVADIRTALAWIPNDERGDWLRVGFALKSTGAGEQAYELWEEWSRATPAGGVHPKFNEKDQRYTWEHATELRADGREVTLLTLFYMAIERGYEGPVPDDLDPEIEMHDAAADTDEVVPAASSAVPERKMTLMDWDEVAEMPPVEWLVDALIPRETVGMLVGDTEAGKTFGSLDLAMRLVHGLDWCGQRVQPCSVLYLAGEGQHGLAGRFRAWRYFHQHLGLDAGDRYCMVSSEIPLLSKKTMHVLTKLVEMVTERKGHAPGLVVIDTLSQALDDDENDAKTVAPVLRGLVALTKRFGCSVLIDHHLVKLNAKLRRGEQAARPTRDSVRGSSALTRNVDYVLGLVVTDEAGGRELHVWKQKDSEKLDPIKLLLTPTETGRMRPDLTEERSCVLALTPNLPERDEAEEQEAGEDGAGGPLVNDQARAQVQAALASIVATLTAEGAVEGPGNRGAMTSNEVAQAVGRKRGVVLAALAKGERDGVLRNAGTARKAAWLVAVDRPKVVPETPGTTDPAEVKQEGSQDAAAG